MTTTQFVKLLKTEKRKTWLPLTTMGAGALRSGGLRSKDTIDIRYCPITAVCFSQTGVFYPARSARSAGMLALRLSEESVSEIIRAADNATNCDMTLRNKMIKALGL